MVTSRDIDKILSLLRRVYGVDRDRHVVRAQRHQPRRSSTCRDTIVEIVTYDSTTIHNTIAVADAFRMIGYPASKVRYLINRADSPGGIEPVDLERALGRVPEHRVVQRRPARRPVEQRGRAVRPRQPGRADQPGPPSRSPPSSSRRTGSSDRRRPAGARARPDVRPAPDRRLRLGRRRADRPPRDPPPLAERIDDLPRRQPPRPVRRPTATTRSGPFSIEALDELAARDVKAIVVACNTSTAVALRRLPAALRPADPRRRPARRRDRVA